MHFYSLDQMLGKDHQARIVWEYVKRLDLEPLYREIKVSDNEAGRTAIAPEILVDLWLLATLDGIGFVFGDYRRSKRWRYGMRMPST